MDASQLDKLKCWFDEFIRPYYSAGGDDYLNTNLRLKECHTHRTCGIMCELAAGLGLHENDTRIAEATALLHDVGRFEQFQKYRTYKDPVSEDHAGIGLRIIRRQQVLAPLDKNEQLWIETAIDLHNKISLPADLDAPTALFCKLIRDADKLDIFSLAIDYLSRYKQNSAALKLEVEFPDTPECSPEILDCLAQKKLIDYTLLKTLNDTILLQMGWIYDIYFPASMKKLLDAGYLHQLAQRLPKTQQVQSVCRQIMRDAAAMACGDSRAV